MKPNDQPAFPRPFSADDVDPDISYPAHVGMTLRDYFAAKAMQVFVERAVSGTAFGVDHADTNLSYAMAAYAMADAMLKAREQ